jgi:hypothetical protein
MLKLVKYRNLVLEDSKNVYLFANSENTDCITYF